MLEDRTMFRSRIAALISVTHSWSYKVKVGLGVVLRSDWVIAQLVRQHRLDNRTSCNSFSPDFHVSGTFERHVTRYDCPMHRAIGKLRAGESHRVAAPLQYNGRHYVYTFVLSYFVFPSADFGEKPRKTTLRGWGISMCVAGCRCRHVFLTQMATKAISLVSLVSSMPYIKCHGKITGGSRNRGITPPPLLNVKGKVCSYVAWYRVC